MITVYGMPSCPDCAAVEEQVKGREDFHVVDIGAHVKDMKTFLLMRDSRPEFKKVREKGLIGIPCFVREDGSITLKPEEVGLKGE